MTSRTRRARRAPLRFELDREQSKAMRMCQALLQKLLQARHARIFDRPVDPVALGIPDYPRIISQPMDMGTIHKRMTSGFYDGPYEFRDDMRLVWNNAMTYNPKGHVVHSAAQEMAQAFEDGFKEIDIEIRNAEAKALSKQQTKRSAGASRSASSRGKQQRRLKSEEQNYEELAALKRQYMLLQQKVARVESMESKRRAGRAQRSERKKKNPNQLKNLTEQEKSELMRGIGRLPEEKLETLVSIVAPGQYNNNEVELDLDSMTVEVYNKVKRFLNLHPKRSEFRTPHGYTASSPRPLLEDARAGGSESSDSSDSDEE